MSAMFPQEGKRRVATLVPFYKESGEVYVFMQKRSAHQNPGKGLGLFGGGIEAGEGVEDGLKREIQEELGIDIAGYRYFTRYEFPKIINEVFILEASAAFADTVTVHEGEWGRFMALAEVLADPDTTNGTKLIVSHVGEFLA